MPMAFHRLGDFPERCACAHTRNQPHELGDFFFVQLDRFAIVGSWFPLDFGAKRAEFLARGCVGDLHDAPPATARFRRLAGAGDAFHSGIFSARAPHLH